MAPGTVGPGGPDARAFRNRDAPGEPVPPAADLPPPLVDGPAPAKPFAGSRASPVGSRGRGQAAPQGRTPARAAWRKSVTAGVPPAARTAVATWPRW